MKIIFLIVLALSLQASYGANQTFRVVNWISKGAFDNVIIENGNSQQLTIQVSVDKTITIQGAKKDTVSAGINIKNCGDTTHLDPGSSAICSSTDKQNPVTFSSDNESSLATGTYQVTTQ